MKKSTTNEIVAVADVNTDSAAIPTDVTFESTLKSVYVKEGRKFNEEDWKVARSWPVPQTLEECKDLFKGKTSSSIYAFFCILGKAENQRIASLYLTNTAVLRDSTIGGLKSVINGRVLCWAGKMTAAVTSSPRPTVA